MQFLLFLVRLKIAGSVLHLLYFSNTANSISPEASCSIYDYLILPSPDFLTKLNTNNVEEENDNDDDDDDDDDNDDNNREDKEEEDNDDGSNRILDQEEDKDYNKEEEEEDAKDKYVYGRKG